MPRCRSSSQTVTQEAGTAAPPFCAQSSADCDGVCSPAERLGHLGSWPGSGRGCVHLGEPTAGCGPPRSFRSEPS